MGNADAGAAVHADNDAASRHPRKRLSVTMPHACVIMAILQVLIHFRYCFKSFVAEAAMPNPDFWDTTLEHLDELVEKSIHYFRPVEHMGLGVRHCNSLPGYTDEDAFRLTNVTVIVMDEDLICKDFPETCSFTTQEKEGWIIDKAGWFSADHIRSNVNPNIPHDVRHVVQTRRACSAGRALLLPTGTSDGPAFIDVKGVGAKNPVVHRSSDPSLHKDGLFYLFEALYEYVNEKTVAVALEDHAVRHSNDPDQIFHTVGIYAVVSFGFQVPFITESGIKRFVASGLVRQASRRHPNPNGWMDYMEAAVLEQILNAYGIRSDGRSNDFKFMQLPNPTCRRINVQGTMMPRTLTDFGTIQGDPEPWPPNKTETCLVHWGNTDRFIETTLWETNDAIGSAHMREWLSKGIYQVLPKKTKDEAPLDFEYARFVNNVLMHQMWELEYCWWYGQCTIDALRKAIQMVLVDKGILSGYDENNGVCAE